MGTGSTALPSILPVLEGLNKHRRDSRTWFCLLHAIDILISELLWQKLGLSTASLVGSSYKELTCFSHATVFSLVLSSVCFHTSVSFPVPFPYLSEEYYWERIVHQTLFRALEES